MPEHDVHINVPSMEVGSTDVLFDVYADGEKLGRLKVSKGGIGWHPRHAPKERHLVWEDFDRLIERAWQ